MNNAATAACKLRVFPGRVTGQIKSAAVPLDGADDRYRYVPVKEVAQALPA